MCFFSIERRAGAIGGVPALALTLASCEPARALKALEYAEDLVKQVRYTVQRPTTGIVR